MRKTVLLLSLTILMSFLATGQSYHFSQFYSTPLLNNPAFTGYTEGPYRIAANFRSQWVMGGSPYQTGAISADFSPLRGKLREGNRLGIGLSLMSDQSSGGALQTNALGFSTAYNLSLDEDNVHHLGVGLQGTFHQRRYDLTKLSFENQYSTGGFSENIPIAESFNQKSKTYLDVNTGVLYNYSLEGKSFFLSAGAYNLLQHNENLQVDLFKVPVRYSFMGGGALEVGYAGMVYFSLNHLKQGTASATTIGGALGLQLGEEKAQEIDFGLWHRLGDAVIPYVGYQVSSLQIGLSYDYTIAKNKTSGNVRNGYELSFVFKGKDNSELKKLVPWY